MIEIKSTFQAESRTVLDLFTHQNRGCFYIPAYQRQYAWEASKVRQMLDDIQSGLAALPENKESLSFIGTIILVKDDKGNSVYPSMINQLPNNVLLVIDGQQRMSTLVLFAVTCSYYIALKKRTLKENKSPAHQWLAGILGSLEANLRDMYCVDVGQPNPDCKYLSIYPRIIRAESDQWSRNEGESLYTSPISALIQSKIFLDQELNIVLEDFDKEIKAIDDKFVSGAVKEMLKCLKAIFENDDSSDESVSDFVSTLYDRFYSDPTVHDSLFHRYSQTKEVQDSFVSIVQDKTAMGLFRLACYTRFFVDRVCITSVLSTSESYAFDMFESLNTTGELLTAVETFKPLVVKKETQRRFRNSIAKVYVDHIESIFDYANGESKKKQSITNDLLKIFCLAEDGTKPSNHLSSQRRMLKKYESRENPDQFLAHLASCARFLKECWLNDGRNEELYRFLKTEQIDEYEFHLQVLKDAKHYQCHPVIARFYHLFLTKPSNQSAYEFIESVRLCLYFFVLWRGSANSTDQIDNGIKSFFTSDIDGKTLKRFFAGISFDLSLGDLKKIMLKRLEYKREDKPHNLHKFEFWLPRMKSLNAFETKTTTKFMLFIMAAHFDCSKIEASPFITPKKYLLKRDVWNNDIQIEHIAPDTRNPDTDWDLKIYENDSTRNLIGNMALLTSSVNASIGNKSWAYKRRVFTLLRNNNEADYMELEKKYSIEISPRSIETLRRAEFSDLISLTPDLDNWSQNEINLRTIEFSKKLHEFFIKTFN